MQFADHLVAGEQAEDAELQVKVLGVKQRVGCLSVAAYLLHVSALDAERCLWEAFDEGKLDGFLVQRCGEVRVEHGHQPRFHFILEEIGHSGEQEQ